MGDRSARSTTQPSNSWDEKQKGHLGSKSALLAPNEGRRRAARTASTGGFKRAGWAAFDEEDAPKPSSRSHKKKATSADAGPSSGGRATPTGKGSADKSGGGTPTSQAESTGKKRPRELFPGEDPPLPSRTRELFPLTEEGEEGDGDGDGDGHVDTEAMAVQAEFEESRQGNGGAGEALPKKKRNRGKRHDEGDAPELKPRHLRGKRKEELLARQAANRVAAAARQKLGVQPEENDEARIRARLRRLLRPKLRRWVMYEWFCSPVDYGWYAENEFTRLLQECGLG